jgi:hypothetical protein
MAALRKEILASTSVSLKSLQRWTGKCVSLMCAIPEVSIFIREANAAIARALKAGGTVTVTAALKHEVGYWAFLDTWEGCVPWRREDHKILTLSSDASLTGYAVVDADGVLVTRDTWKVDDQRPIHIKEAEGALAALRISKEKMKNGRIVINVDNKAVIDAWKGFGDSKSRRLNNIMKDMFLLTREYNMDVKLKYVPSADNLADKPSREITMGDTALGEVAWGRVEQLFGPHSVDGMALDNNTKLPRFFSPHATTGSAGVDFFAQDIKRERNIYVFPPFVMIGPLLSFLRQLRVASTVVLPEVSPRPAWWPMVVANSVGRLLLGQMGEKGVILVPSKKGFRLDADGLKQVLVAYRLDFGGQ